MKYILFFIILLIYSCNKISCSNLEYTDGLTYKNGKLYTGDCSDYFSNGQVRSIQTYLNGMDHGKWKFYHPGQIPQTLGEFKNGIRIGTWKYYYSNGKIWKINKYDSTGKKVGKWFTYAMDGTTDTIVTFSKSDN